MAFRASSIPMFNNLMKKLGEVEQEFSKNIAASPNRSEPSVQTEASGDQVQQLLKQIERYKERMAIGAREFDKVFSLT